MTDVKESIKEEILSITKRVLAALNLNDDGKINRFFKDEVKKARTSIRNLELNLETTKRNAENTLENLDGDLEDAQEKYETSFEDIDLESIKNNASRSTFANIFWENIANAEEDLELVKEEIENVKEDYQKEEKELKTQIARYQTRIDKIIK